MTDKYFPTRSLNTEFANEDEWFNGQRSVFPSYLIYLNGKYMEEKLAKKESISVQEMADAIVENHKLTRIFYVDHNEKLTWFTHN
jgi:hypothetical protein